MQVYIVQNEKDEICYVSIATVDVLEEIERMGKTALTLGIWTLGDLQKLNEVHEEIKANAVTTNWTHFHSTNPNNSNYEIPPYATTSCEVNKDFITQT